MSGELGKVVATEESPSTPHEFRFRTEISAHLGIGSIVKVEGDSRIVYGVVTDGYAYAAQEFNHPIGEESAGPEEVRVWRAAVLRQLPGEPLQPVPQGAVCMASNKEIVSALRMDEFVNADTPTGIPVGLYSAGGTAAPVQLDSDFLLGPEAAHLNITGVSGLATKTSAVTFLLQSIFQSFPASRGSVAALCINGKGPDLCFLDQPATLSAADLKIWHQLGLQPMPFEDVTLYAPYKADGVNLNTLRSNEQLRENVEPLVWGLREILDFAEVALNRDDIDAKAGALIDFLKESVVGKRFADAELRPEPFEVESFADLDEFFRSIFRFLESSKRGADSWRTHHIATIRKVRNRLGNIVTRSHGLVTDDGLSNDLPWGEFRDRSLTVVDIAGVDPLAQELVLARIVSRLREHLERRDLGVDHLVVFVDELNKYAPVDGPDTYIKQMLLDLSERGRYLGLVLFSAQEFRSQVIRRVVGNSATSLYGRMDPDELALPAYNILSPAVKARLAALPKGELMVRHPHFTQPVFVHFPRPASLSGRDGVELFPPAEELPFEDAVVSLLQQRDKDVSPVAIRELIDGRPHLEVRRALSMVARHQPDDVLGYFRGCLRKVIVAESRSVASGVAPLAHSDDDPFAPY